MNTVVGYHGLADGMVRLVRQKAEHFVEIAVDHFFPELRFSHCCVQALRIAFRLSATSIFQVFLLLLCEKVRAASRGRKKKFISVSARADECEHKPYVAVQILPHALYRLPTVRFKLHIDELHNIELMASPGNSLDLKRKRAVVGEG